MDINIQNLSEMKIFLINIFKIHLSVIVRKILKIYLVFIGIKPRKIHIQRQNFI